MKYVRYALLCLTAAALILLCIGTAKELSAIAGDLGVFGQLLVDPTMVTEAFEIALVEYNLDPAWFAQHGPYAIVLLIITLFFACIP